MTSLNLPILLNSICDITQCIESDSINFQSISSDSVHFRIDGKAITDQTIPKCDCLIIYSPPSSAFSFILMVEVKKDNPDPRDFVRQLDSCRDKYHELVYSIIQNYPPLTLSHLANILPSPHKHDTTLKQLLLTIIDHMRRYKIKFLPILCASKHVSRMKRTGSTKKFRLKNKQLIIYLKSGQNIETVIYN